MPVTNVTKPILEKVIQYATFHKQNDMMDEDKKNQFDREFTSVDQETLFDLILAANYLDIKPLLDLTCLTVANMIKGKTPEEIRATFNIANDFSPEEEAKVREENSWIELE